MKNKLLVLTFIIGTFFDLAAQDSTALSFNVPSNQNNLLSLSYKTGSHSNGYAFTYYHFLKGNFKGWYFPYSLSLENISVMANGISELNAYPTPAPNFIVPGISAMKNIATNLWINFGLQIPLGVEVYNNPSSLVSQNIYHPIIGLAPVQEIFFIPRTTYGLIAGIGVFERISNAYKYQNDIGLQLELGLKF
jgi:hypothetical protein